MNAGELGYGNYFALIGSLIRCCFVVIQKSKTVEFSHIRDKVLAAHKESVELDQMLWVERQGAHEIRAESERVLNKFADISNRLKSSHLETLRKNLIDSLKLFFQRNGTNIPLRKVSSVVSGPLHWFKHHNPQLSASIMSYASNPMTGIMSFEPRVDAASIDGDSASVQSDGIVAANPAPDSAAGSQGVTLAAAAEGVCVGVIRMPKLGLWSLRIPISRQGKGPRYAGDPYAKVIIRMGPSLSSLALVGEFHNYSPDADDDDDDLSHDCIHVFRGELIVFRFEFVASDEYAEDILKHLAVGEGMFEERQMLPLEISPQRDSKGREKVISSLVKMLRIEEKSGKMRETVLLEELIRAEDADPLMHKTWDSALLSDTPQRYSREYFMRLLRAEILMEHAKNVAVLEETQQAMNSKHNRRHDDTLAEEREAKLKVSCDKYYARVRAKQQHTVEKGLSQLHRRLEIYDKSSDKWRHVLVMHVSVRWVDNGTKPHLIHTVQEFDDDHEAIGNEFEVDLSRVRYFDSASQTIDEHAVRRNKQQKAWEKRLREIESQAQGRISEVRQSLQNFKDKETKLFQSFEDGMLNEFRASSEVGAENALADPVNARTYNSIVSACLLDIKKGIIKVDPDSELKPSQQGRCCAVLLNMIAGSLTCTVLATISAQQYAVERFKKQWMDTELARINRTVDNYNVKMNRRVTKFSNECVVLEKKIRKESSGEKYRLEQSIQEKREADKARQLKRLRCVFTCGFA
jgi:hypothetical protein